MLCNSIHSFIDVSSAASSYVKSVWETSLSIHSWAGRRWSREANGDDDENKLLNELTW